MATMRGNAGGYGMGAPSYGGINNSPSEGGNALDAIRQQTSKIEDFLDSAAEPVKPYVNHIRGHVCQHEALHVGKLWTSC